MLLYLALACAALVLLALLVSRRSAPPAPLPAIEPELGFLDLDGAAASELVATTPELVVLDVRTPLEYAGGHLPNARSLPLDRLEAELPALAPETPLLVYCAMGGRSAAACARLVARGFRRVHNLEHGLGSFPTRT